MPDLYEKVNSSQWDRREHSCSPRFTLKEVREPRNYAREGGEPARDSLVASCLNAVTWMTTRDRRSVPHDDSVDLADRGNLAAATSLEQARVMDTSCASLYAVARSTMLECGRTRASLITQRRDRPAPGRSPRTESKRKDLLDRIATPEQEPEGEGASSAQRDEALEALPEPLESDAVGWTRWAAGESAGHDEPPSLCPYGSEALPSAPGRGPYAGSLAPAT